MLMSFSVFLGILIITIAFINPGKADFLKLKNSIRPDYIRDFEKVAKKKYIEQFGTETSLENYKNNVEIVILRSGINIKFYEFILINIISILVVTYIVHIIFNNPLITLVFVYIGYKLPFVVFEYVAKKKQEEIDKHIEGVLTQISAIYGTVGTLEQCIEKSIPTMPSPVKELFEQAMTDMKIAGRDLSDTLENLAIRINNKDFDFWVKIALIAVDIGGETRKLMLQIPETIRERKNLRDELETELSGLKFQGWILFSGTPLIFLTYKILRPDFASVLTDTFAGKVTTTVIAIICILSLWLINKLSRPV